MSYANNPLMQALSELDDDLAKSQIVQGSKPSPSERQSWAGSDWEDQSVPSHAPDGTNYVPRGAANKSVHQMSTGELEAYIQMRKSARPNFAQAEAEILALPGVSKSVCGSCGGFGYVGNNPCSHCNGSGNVYTFLNKSMIPHAEQIADAYNCGPNSGLSKSFDSDASLTPKNMPSYKDVGSGAESEMAKKGAVGDIEDYDEEGAMKGFADELKDKACKAINKAFGVEEDMEDEDDSKELSPVEKSLLKGIHALIKSQEALIDKVEDLEETQKGLEEKHDKGNAVTSEIAKSMIGYNPALGQSGPARGAQSVFHAGPQQVNVHQPPHQQQAPQQAAPNGAYQSRYTRAQLQSAAEDMVQKSLIDAMQVVRMDSGAELDAHLIQHIESYIDSTGAPQQQAQQYSPFGRRG